MDQKHILIGISSAGNKNESNQRKKKMEKQIKCVMAARQKDEKPTNKQTFGFCLAQKKNNKDSKQLKTVPPCIKANNLHVSL